MERKNSGYKINLEKPMDKQKKNKIKSNKLNINNAKILDYIQIKLNQMPKY